MFSRRSHGRRRLGRPQLCSSGLNPQRGPGHTLAPARTSLFGEGAGRAVGGFGCGAMRLASWGRRRVMVVRHGVVRAGGRPALLRGRARRPPGPRPGGHAGAVPHRERVQPAAGRPHPGNGRGRRRDRSPRRSYRHAARATPAGARRRRQAVHRQPAQHCTSTASTRSWIRPRIPSCRHPPAVPADPRERSAPAPIASRTVLATGAFLPK